MENNEQSTILEQRLDALEAKLDAVYTSVEKTRKYFMIMMWGSVAVVVLPALGLAIAIPAFINSYVGAIDGLL